MFKDIFEIRGSDYVADYLVSPRNAMYWEMHLLNPSINTRTSGSLYIQKHVEVLNRLGFKYEDHSITQIRCVELLKHMFW